LKTCRICGAKNADNANACSVCGIGFRCASETRAQEGREVRIRAYNKWPLRIGVIAILFIIAAVAAAILARPKAISEWLTRKYDAFINYASCSDNTAYRPVYIVGEDGKMSLDTSQNINEEAVWTRRPPYDIGIEFANDATAWNLSRNGFFSRHPRIQYSNDGNNLISVRNDDLTFFGYPVCENVFEFGSNGLARIELSLFNKGMADALPGEAPALTAVQEISIEILGANVDTSTIDDGAGKSITRYRWTRRCPEIMATLGKSEYDGIRYVEYLNFTMSINGDRVLNVRNPKDNVRHLGGDVFIDGIPMINQGRKGYCVPATISRLLQYYGIDADIHDLALLMETECGGGGTLVGGEFPTLNRIADETGLKRTDYRNLECCNNEYLSRYNAAAHDNGAQELNIEDFTAAEERDGEMVNIQHYDWLYEAMDPEIRRKSRFYDSKGFSTFKLGILSSINEGWPLLWSVDRCFPWDIDDGSIGNGHMRLIIGYNTSTDEVIYSDSWGKGHEFKRASMSDAWGVTDFMSCLSP